jgi:hypothetical protein
MVAALWLSSGNLFAIENCVNAIWGQPNPIRGAPADDPQNGDSGRSTQPAPVVERVMRLPFKINGSRTNVGWSATVTLQNQKVQAGCFARCRTKCA